MKHTIFLTLLFIDCLNCFSQEANYNNQNGTVLMTEVVNTVKWEIRKHIQNLELGNLAREENMTLYRTHSLGSEVVAKLSIGNKIEVEQVARATIKNRFQVWLNVTVDKVKSGWMFFGDYANDFAKFSDPYFENRWEIVGTIEAGKTWTVRKMVGQMVSVWEVLNIRDKPGLTGTRVLSTITHPKERPPQVNLNVVAATDEKETIDGRTDHWLQIKYGAVDGWIFGGYASVERGGPKYYMPDSIIAFRLENY